jgi:hypothetical protein
MSEVASRADIDEVVGIVRDFMQQMDGKLNSIGHEITELKESHNESPTSLRSRYQFIQISN